MSAGVAPAAGFAISSDGPAIDFANTADWHAAETPVELLTDYPRLVAWGEAAGLLSEEQANDLRRVAAQRRPAAEAALTAAIDLREALYRIFSALAAGNVASPADLAFLNAALPEALRRLRVEPGPVGPGYTWGWQADPADLTWFLAPVVRAAADLLVSPEISRVRECAGHPCGWIFLDHSRNRSRRWCSMAGCGNRAKARRHYARVKRNVAQTKSSG